MRQTFSIRKALGTTVLIILAVVVWVNIFTYEVEPLGNYTSNSLASNDSESKQFAWIEKGKLAVKAQLKDPKSAEFRSVYFSRGSLGVPMTCGEVNSKNSFGGYGGYQRFVSGTTPSTTYLEEQVSGFSDIWNRFCK